MIQIFSFGVDYSSGEDANSLLTGFTIQNASYSGVYCMLDSDPVISNCIIQNSSAYGVACFSSSGPLIRNCIIKDNGGGLFGWTATCLSLTNSEVFDNTNYGIGMLWPGDCLIANNLIYNNGAMGIAVRVAGSGTVIRNNTIYGNGDAGIHSADGDPDPTITNCIIWDCNDALIDCNATFSCIDDGDAGEGNISSDPCFLHICDFIDETTAAGTTTTVIVTDASLYDVNDVIEYDLDNTVRTVSDVNTTSDTITFSPAIDANSVSGVRIDNWGIGATDLYDNLHIATNSPCLDEGDSNDVEEDEVDIDGDDRIIGDDVDMGADEDDS